jgi:hypothetical protein
VPEVELEGLSSPEVLEHTAAEGRVLVTATLQVCRRPSNVSSLEGLLAWSARWVMKRGWRG